MNDILQTALFVSAFNALVKRALKAGMSHDVIRELSAAVVNDKAPKSLSKGS